MATGEWNSEKQLWLQALQASEDLRDNLDALIGFVTKDGTIARPMMEHLLSEHKRGATETHRWLNMLLESWDAQS